MKASSGKFSPLHQFFFFDALEALPDSPLPAEGPSLSFAHLVSIDIGLIIINLVLCCTSVFLSCGILERKYTGAQYWLPNIHLLLHRGGAAGFPLRRTDRSVWPQDLRRSPQLSLLPRTSLTSI